MSLHSLQRSLSSPPRTDQPPPHVCPHLSSPLLPSPSSPLTKWPTGCNPVRGPNSILGALGSVMRTDVVLSHLPTRGTKESIREVGEGGRERGGEREEGGREGEGKEERGGREG